MAKQRIAAGVYYKVAARTGGTPFVSPPNLRGLLQYGSPYAATTEVERLEDAGEGLHSVYGPFTEGDVPYDFVANARDAAVTLDEGDRRESVCDALAGPRSAVVYPSQGITHAGSNDPRQPTLHTRIADLRDAVGALLLLIVERLWIPKLLGLLERTIKRLTRRRRR